MKVNVLCYIYILSNQLLLYNLVSQNTLKLERGMGIYPIKANVYIQLQALLGVEVCRVETSVCLVCNHTLMGKVSFSYRRCPALLEAMSPAQNKVNLHRAMPYGSEQLLPTENSREIPGIMLAPATLRVFQFQRVGCHRNKLLLQSFDQYKLTYKSVNI